MNRIVLITGGARSGKSHHAIELSSWATEKAFIATAEPTDEEMHNRIEQHRAERGNDFRTLEEPLDLAAAISSLRPDTQIAVVDCLTVWLGNLMHHRSIEDYLCPEVTSFLSAIKESPCELVIVSNELGMGLVPEGEMGRRFRDLAGRVNQEVARIANKVVFMVSGIPVVIKEG
ncbi:MAG: bifunctional adenosylcobinamide kinase/adenosylcobinamide-phosphate guanylyltransferase [Deltaproteobacteria bacterium]|nr:bifunctional adenosylcobinamide kinase/adenosylcobinamide-phosphate guanylyltransferase [Deltaproteobacteria bacterium]